MLAACLVSLSAHAADDDLLSRDALFGDDLPKLTSSQNNSGPGIKGFIQFEAARTIAEPEHWSKLRSRAELGTSGKLGDSMKWKVGARFDYDFAYAINDFYPSDVEKISVTVSNYAKITLTTATAIGISVLANST
jgi:hypothetical protein